MITKAGDKSPAFFLPIKMKKAYFTIFLLFIIYSQQRILSQTHFEGNKIITPYYGFPNFGYLTLANSESNGLNAKYKSIGPLGLRAEYLFSDKIGLGFEIIYNSYKLNFTRESTIYDGNSDKWLTQYTEVYKEMKRLRIQFRYTYHFDVRTPNLDWYSGFGLGTNTRIYKYLENGKKVNINSQTSDSTNTNQNQTFPLSLRLFCGVNYYFNQRLGVGIEVGLGGALISTSISFKIF